MKPAPKPAQPALPAAENDNSNGLEQQPLDMAMFDGEPAPGTFNYRVRPYRGEQAFVIGTWLRDYQGAPGIKSVPYTEYWPAHEKLAKALVDRGTVFVAEHVPHQTLLGFSVGERDREGNVLHYVYVKSWARRQGIATALLDTLMKSLRGTYSANGNVRYTHNKREPFTLIAGKRGWKYSPYPAYRKGWE